MQKVATLMLRLQQCAVSSPETCQPTPTQSQWNDTQKLAARVSAAMEWAFTEIHQQLSHDDLRSIIGLFHTLVELLYKLVYVHALNQQLNMTQILR